MKKVVTNKKSKSTPLKIRYIEINKNQTVTHLLSQMKHNAFNARKLFNCAEIWLKACIENTRKYFTLATAIIPAGYGKLIGQMIENGMIDVLITTSANMAHDAGQELFDVHYLGSENANDKILYNADTFRIYDIFTESKKWSKFQKFLRDEFCVMIYKKYGSNPLPRQIFSLLGAIVNDNKKGEGILATAYHKGIEIYCPTFMDSIFGMILEQHNEHNPSMYIAINQTGEFQELKDDIKKYNTRSIFICGGGTPKNFTFQASLMLHESKKRGFDYAIQITTDAPHWGGLSGATLEEAISWGKVRKEARHQTVYADATLALPIIAQYILDSWVRKD